MLSSCSSVQITTIKGLFSGLGSLIVALVMGEPLPALPWIAVVMLLSFVAYGLSINFYIKAQMENHDHTHAEQAKNAVEFRTEP